MNRRFLELWLVLALIVPGAAKAGSTDVRETAQPVVLDSTLAAFGMCYATLGNTTPNGGALVMIDPVTGAGTIVGPTGVTGFFGDPGVPALAIRSSGEVYAMDIGPSANLYVVDAMTGAATLVGASGLASPPAIAFDGNDMLYAIDANGDLYTINEVTAAATLVGATGVFIKGMAFDPTDGKLWGSDASSGVYIINHHTSSTTFIGKTGVSPCPDICFDQAGVLYGASGGGLSANSLITIDKSTGAGTVVGSIGFPSVSGMAARLDRLVPAALQAYDSKWLGNRVQVRWRLIGIEGAITFDIGRAVEGRAYDRVPAPAVVRSGGEFVYVDDSVYPGTTYRYRVVVLEDGEAVTSFETSVTAPMLEVSLEQNRPNPFNPTTEIRFGIGEAADVSLSVYDASGRLIRTLFDGRANPGSYLETWDGRDARGSAVGSGMYFYRLRAGERTLTRKMILLK